MSSGSLKWKYQTGDRVDSSPKVGSDGTIYVGSVDFYLYAITSTGNMVHRYDSICVAVILYVIRIFEVEISDW
jgi:outer membrane protein assembly factor BamB